MKNKDLLSCLLLKEFTTASELKKIVPNPGATVDQLRQKGFVIHSKYGFGYKLDEAQKEKALEFLGKEVKKKTFLQKVLNFLS